MAFVNCKQFKESQAEQDERLDALEECCNSSKEALDVSNDSGLTNKNGKLAVADSLAGSGLTLEKGIMSVATVEITDASSKHTLGYAVDKEA